MKPRIMFGLIFGILGMLPSICASGLLGFCGSALMIVLAGGAGLLTGFREKAATRIDGGKAGAIAGALTGALLLIGQILQWILGMSLTAYSHPSSMTNSVGQYVPMIISTLIIGIISLFVATGVGAAAAFVATPNPQAAQKPI